MDEQIQSYRQAILEIQHAQRRRDDSEASTSEDQSQSLTACVIAVLSVQKLQPSSNPHLETIYCCRCRDVDLFTASVPGIAAMTARTFALSSGTKVLSVNTEHLSKMLTCYFLAVQVLRFPRHMQIQLPSTPCLLTTGP